jgi:hypothetical protein
MASQVLIGCETLELMVLVEGLVAKKIQWIPFSFHHDGYAFLAARMKLSMERHNWKRFAKPD